MPVVFIDFYNYEVFYFEDTYEAKEYIEDNYTDWYESPPEGKDKELITIKFCTQEDKERYDRLYENYKFYKIINGQNIYKEKSLVEFQPEVVVNVFI